ncbi:hypothetical protein GGR51DRAFT_245074 [Nemania sp. FL0031]|nr:hypothetical protein GGR51DRAFT_245074 [Nemania sp. FL0031]
MTSYLHSTVLVFSCCQLRFNISSSKFETTLWLFETTLVFGMSPQTFQLTSGGKEYIVRTIDLLTLALGVTTFKAILDYSNGVEPMLPKAFTEEKQKSYWYIFIMEIATTRRRQGLAFAMLKDSMERARNDERPV